MIQVPVARIRGTEGSISARYEVPNDSSPGSATAGVDFARASGILTWGDGEIGLKYVPVKFIDDTIGENTETFQIRLVGVNVARSWSRE